MTSNRDVEAQLLGAVVGLAKDVGEFKAQVRELIHKEGEDAQRKEAVSRILIKLEDLPHQVERLGERLDERLQALEDDQIRRDQTANIWTLMLKSPAIGWIVGIVSAAALYLFGRGQ